MSTPKTILTFLLFAGSAVADVIAPFRLSQFNTYEGPGHPAGGGSWAFIYDQNDDLALPGGLEDDEHLLFADQGAVIADFGSAFTIANNTVLANGDRIIATGAIPADGIVPMTMVTFQYSGPYAVAEGRRFGIYWFPNNAVGTTLDTTGAFTMGGFFDLEPPTDYSRMGMTIPLNGTSSPLLFYDGYPQDRLVAANFSAVPEPACLTLSLMGLGVLLRRRRAVSRPY